MFDLFYALSLMLAFCVAMGVSAFVGWLLFERDNAPFKSHRQRDEEV